jgi:hypothetical protein
MTVKIITQIARCVAAAGIAVLPLAIAEQAHAINKHEKGGGDVVQPAPRDRDFDPSQVAVGALGGAAVTGAALKASARLRNHRT